MATLMLSLTILKVSPNVLAFFLAAVDLLLDERAVLVAHDIEDIFDADLALGRHVLNDIAGRSELVRKAVDDRVARPRR